MYIKSIVTWKTHNISTRKCLRHCTKTLFIGVHLCMYVWVCVNSKRKVSTTEHISHARKKGMCDPFSWRRYTESILDFTITCRTWLATSISCTAGLISPVFMTAERLDWTVFKAKEEKINVSGGNLFRSILLGLFVAQYNANVAKPQNLALLAWYGHFPQFASPELESFELFVSLKQK